VVCLYVCLSQEVVDVLSWSFGDRKTLSQDLILDVIYLSGDFILAIQNTRSLSLELVYVVRETRLDGLTSKC